MVNLKVRLEGDIAYIEVHVIGTRVNPDFSMQIDIVKRKILFHNAPDEHDFYLNNVFWGIIRRVDAKEDIEKCTCIAWF